MYACECQCACACVECVHGVYVYESMCIRMFSVCAWCVNVCTRVYMYTYVCLVFVHGVCVCTYVFCLCMCMSVCIFLHVRILCGVCTARI